MSEYILADVDMKYRDGTTFGYTQEIIGELVRCKDCRFFEYDHVDIVSGIPLITGHEMCLRWGDGCKTSEYGYCFLAERKEE